MGKELVKMKNTGKVYLVGAGPGDKGLITEKGLNRLHSCDAIVYDSLSSDELLSEVPDRCQKIYVGKRCGHHSMKQTEINKILIELAQKGLTVVRLKGGDPFVFGRGGEEIMALSDHGIPYEVISGVTSAIAALASAGIPVTHRGISRSFHVMTGHTMAADGSVPPDFHAFARLSGTLVFLMGLRNLPVIVNGLLKQGKSADTPAAVIQNGTLANQKSVRGTLADIEEKTKEAGMGSPAIIVVGDVVSLDLSSTLQDPLKGCRIGITGTPALTEKLKSALENEGASVEKLLTLGMKSYRSEAAMVRAYKNLRQYTWIVFTSANAVREFFAGLMEQGYDNRALGHLRFATVGKGTGRELRQYGFRSDYIPDRYCALDLAVGLKGILDNEDRLLIPRSKGGSSELNRIFDENGNSYDDIILYDVEPLWKEGELSDLSLEGLNYITFASTSGVEAFFQQAPADVFKSAKEVKIVCIGDITAKALEAHGKMPDIVADEYSTQGITEAVISDWKKNQLF